MRQCYGEEAQALPSFMPLDDLLSPVAPLCIPEASSFLQCALGHRTVPGHGNRVSHCTCLLRLEEPDEWPPPFISQAFPSLPARLERKPKALPSFMPLDDLLSPVAPLCIPDASQFPAVRTLDIELCLATETECLMILLTGLVNASSAIAVGRSSRLQLQL